MRARPFATGSPLMITVTGSRRSPCFHVAISLKGSRSCFPDDPFGPWSPPTGLFLSRTLPCLLSFGRADGYLLVAAGARQPSKKLAQVIIGDERAASELASHAVSVADRAVHGISAEAGQRARLRDAVRAAASLGGVLRHVCRPALGAVRVTDGRWTTNCAR